MLLKDRVFVLNNLKCGLIGFRGRRNRGLRNGDRSKTLKFLPDGSRENLEAKGLKVEYDEEQWDLVYCG